MNPNPSEIDAVARRLVAQIAAGTTGFSLYSRGPLKGDRARQEAVGRDPSEVLEPL